MLCDRCPWRVSCHLERICTSDRAAQRGSTGTCQVWSTSGSVGPDVYKLTNALYEYIRLLPAGCCEVTCIEEVEKSALAFFVY